MRALILVLALAALAPAAQEPAASQQLKEKFLGILKGQITEMLKLIAGRDERFTADDVTQGAESMMKEVETSYGPLLTLPEAEAGRLLTTGPDDKANMAAMKRDIELWKKVQRPLPALYKKMQDDVTIGVIKGGLPLELTRRLSEFHLRQLGLFP